MSIDDIHFPDSSAYVAGHIIKDDDEYRLELANLYYPSDGDPVFPNKLMAIKVENHTAEDLDVKLEAVDAADAPVGSCIEARVSCEPWVGPMGPIQQGAWLWVNEAVTKVQVIVSVEGTTVVDAEIPISQTGNRITMYTSAEGPVAKSGEQGARRGRVFATKGDQGLCVRLLNRSDTPFVASGKDEVTVGAATNDPGRGVVYVANSGDLVTISWTDDRGRARVEQFEVFDVGGHTVTIMNVGTSKSPHLVSAPYALTPLVDSSASTGPDQHKVSVVNETDSDIWVWRQGEGDAADAADQHKILVAKGCQGEFAFDEGFSNQWTLHWDAGGDPKVIVKHDDCGN